MKEKKNVFRFTHTRKNDKKKTKNKKGNNYSNDLLNQKYIILYFN